MHYFSSVSLPAAYEPFLFNGYDAISGDNETKQVTLLRDTGAAQSIVLDTMFVLSPETYTNTDVFLHGVDSDCIKVLLHRMYLK